MKGAGGGGKLGYWCGRARAGCCQPPTCPLAYRSWRGLLTTHPHTLQHLKPIDFPVSCGHVARRTSIAASWTITKPTCRPSLKHTHTSNVCILKDFQFLFPANCCKSEECLPGVRHEGGAGQVAAPSQHQPQGPSPNIQNQNVITSSALTAWPPDVTLWPQGCRCHR